MELDPIQQQQLVTFQSNFEGSQEEYDRQLAELYAQFKRENEQKELAARFDKRKKQILGNQYSPADQAETTAGANQDGVSSFVQDIEPLSLESFLNMTLQQKRGLSYDEQNRLFEEAENRELFNDYVLDPENKGFTKNRIPDDLRLEDIAGNLFEIKIPTAQLLESPIMEDYTKLYYESKGLNYEKIKEAKDKSEYNQGALEVLKGASYMEKQPTADNTMLNIGLALGMGGPGTQLGVGSSGQTATAKFDKTTGQNVAPEIKEEYPELFDDNGDWAFNSYEELQKHRNKLGDENRKYADITASKWNREIEKEIDIKFKNLLDESRIEQKVMLEYIEEKAKETEKFLFDSYQVTSADVGDFDNSGAVDFVDTTKALISNFDQQLNILEVEVQDRLGIPLSKLNTFKPSNADEEAELQNFLIKQNNLYTQAIPLNEVLAEMNSLTWATDYVNQAQKVNQVLMNFGDVARTRGEYESGKFASIVNNVKKGFVQGELNDEFWRVAYGITDLDDPEELKRVSETVALLTAKNNGILTSEVWEDYTNAKTVSEKFEILGQEPGEILLSLFGNSMAQFWETGDELIIPVVGGATAIGAGVGSTAGGVGAIPGGLTGLQYGLATWQGITALNMEIGNAYQTVMTEAGLDLSNPEDVIAGLKDPKIIAKADELGLKRGIPIAIMNLVSAKVSTSMIGRTALSGSRTKIATAVGAGFIVDPVFEGTGELGAQVISGEGIKPTEIMDEMIGGTAGTASNISVKLMRMSIFNEAAKQAQKLKNLDAMVNSNYSTQKIDEFTNRLEKQKKITSEDAKVLRDNARIIDEANNQIKNNAPKGKVSNNVKLRLADLIKNKKLIKSQPGLETAAAKSLKQINEEISLITKDNALKSENSFVTIKDFANKQKQTLNAVTPFLKSLGIDSEVEIIEINTQEDYNKLPSVFNKQNVIDVFKNSTVSAFASEYVQGQPQYIVVNNQNVQKNGVANLINQGSTDVAAVSVAHEVLHTVLDRSFNETQIIDLGNKLTTYVNEQMLNDGKNISAGVVSKINDRLKVYGSYNEDGTFVPSKENPNYTEAMYASEVFTALSDEMSLGNIQWDRQDKGFWQRVANDLTDYYKFKVGINPAVINAANIQTGEQAFNFVKNFNKSFYGGRKLTKKQIATTTPKAPVVEEPTKKEVGKRKSQALPGDIKSNLDAFTGPAESRKYTDNAAFRATEDFASAFNALENTDLLDGSIAGLPGVTQEYLNQNPEFIRDVKERIGERFLRNYDAGLNSLFGWLTGKNKSGKSIIELSAGDIQNRNKRRPGGTSLDQDRREGSFDVKETIAAETDTNLKDLETRNLSPTRKTKEVKQKTFSEQINVAPSLQKEIIESVTNILDPENKSLPSVTQPELRKKLEQAFSKELYKKVRPLLGRTIEQYTEFLDKNYKALWDKIPQSAVNKRFTELSTVVNDRMSASESNIADRQVKNIYAGNALRIKNNLTKQDFVDYFTKGKKVRSRKESLAQVLATELAKDEVNNVLMDNPDLRNRWIGQQELMNDNLKQNYIAMLSVAIDRATPDSQGLRYSQVVQTAETLGISQEQLVGLLNELSLNEMQQQQPLIYDSIIDSFNYWVDNTVKVIGRINDGFVKVIKNQFPNFVGNYNNRLQEYINNKEYNWVTDYTDLEGNKRKIYNSERYDTWLNETLDQIKYMPVEVLKALSKLKNQNYNWLTKMHMKDNGSSRGGSPVGMVYNADGSLISEDRQKKVTPEEYEEGRRVSKEVFKKKYQKAIADAIKNNKATEQTKAKWKNYKSSDIELGNKGAATMGHILSVYRNIANKPWGAQTKANVMSRIMGPRGKASLKSGLALMDAYHSSLNDWVNNEVKGGRNRGEAMTSIFANMQMTTNAVYSARAYASFTSFYFVDGPQNIDNKFKGYKGEHVQDSSSTTSSIFMSMLDNSFEDNIAGILEGYEQSAMLESDTKRIDEVGGKNSPLGNIRFLLEPKLGKQIFNLDGVSKYQEVLNEYDQIFRTAVGANVRVDDTAMKIRKSQGPRKGISVWDFDDTLAKTNSKVGVEMPDGTTRKINAEEFAKTSDQLSEQGAKFDFSEFNKVMRGKKGPMFEKALARNKKFGNENVYILTARPQASATAIQKFLKGIGLDIPLKNITGLEDGRPEAKAAWVEDKVLEGYNDFYFADDAYKNVKAVQESLNKYDIKSRTEVAGFRNSMTNSEKFNTILEQTKGIKADEMFSDARARQIGKNIGRFKFFVPPSAEDFVGLIYSFLGKGKVGEAQLQFFKDSLIKPFGQAMQALSIAQNASRRNYNTIRKRFDKKFLRSLSKESEYKGFTNQDAARVYMWVKGGYDIPGLNKQDINRLVEVVENNENLKSFADQVFNMTGEGYVQPSENWTASNISGDLQGNLRDISRKQYLSEWVKNKNEIFSKENLNKIEALYGSNFREALEDILYRMENGTNRNFGKNRLVNNFMNWINNSVGTIMFFNARSAVLQTISAVNFINLGDNNPIAVAKTLLNQKQYWSDFVKIFNSDFLQQRRKGNRIDVSASEIANYVANSKNPIKAGIAYLLDKGFLPTQIADSFAISVGGASFFRNRVQTYVNQGLSLQEAESKAFGDFQELTEEAQQSSRPDRISQQQAGPLGRVILAFANTPMQYTRLIKKATLDLINKRGDWKTNVSKIIYYGAIQNYIFNALQNAMFALLWDDDEEKEKEKDMRTLNGMADSLLRGTGLPGAITSTVKNMVLKAIEESEKRNPEYTKVAITALGISPPVSSKIRKIAQVGNIVKYDGDEIMEKGLSFDNPAWLAGGKLLSAFFNVPADRVVQKMDNLKVAVDNETQWWQSIALALGWDQWSLGLGYNKKKEEIIIPDNKFLKKFKTNKFKAPKFKTPKFKRKF